MEILNKIVAYILPLDRKLFRKYLIIFLVGVSAVAGWVTYYIHQQKSELITYIKQLHKLTEKSFKLIAENREMTKEEQRLKEVFEINKDFSMKGFFEQFCREQGIVPDAGWDARVEPVNEKFDEIILPAAFKGLTTEKLVAVLDALDKKEIVYTKNLIIRTQEGKKISVDVVLATKKYKTVFE